MGAPVQSGTGTTICSTPFLIREYTFTSGTTATAFTHGGPAAVPDMALVTSASANPTATDNAVYTLTTTQFTLDCEDDGNDTLKVYLIWFDAAAGGIS